MTALDSLVAHRWRAQSLDRAFDGRPSGLVEWFGAVQAQEYPYAKWGILRRLTPAITDADVEGELEAGVILRTHVMRPTWHFVHAADIGWMLDLTGPRIRTAMAFAFRYYGIEPKVGARAVAIIERHLADGRSATRAELHVALRRSRLDIAAIPMGMVMMAAEIEQVVCSGPRRANQATYALLSDRLAGVRGRVKPRAMSGPDEACAELARRFLRSHGPATLRDFVWWSGLRTVDARRGVDAAGARRHDVEAITYWSLDDVRRAPGKARGVRLLPIYDEYLVSYRDRAAVPHGPRNVTVEGRRLPFRHSLVIDGQVAGTWRVEPSRLRVIPLRTLTAAELRAVGAEARRFLSSSVIPLSSRSTQLPLVFTPGE